VAQFSVRLLRRFFRPGLFREFRLPGRAATLLVSAAGLLASGVMLVQYTANRLELRAAHSRIWRIGYHQTEPFISRGPDGNPVGFGRDVLAEAARRAGIRLQWVFIPRGATEGFRLGEIDLFPRSSDVPGMKRAPYITESWFESYYGLAERASIGSSPHRQYRGERVATGPTPFAEVFALQNLPGAHIVPRPNWKDALASVCTGQAEAAFAELREAMAALAARPEGCQDQRIQLWPIPKAVLEAGIGSTMRARFVADRLRAEIGNIAAEGKLSEMHARWYLATPNEVTSVSQVSEFRKTQRILVGISCVLLLLMGAAGFVAWKMRALRLTALRASDDYFRAQEALKTARDRFELAVRGSNDGIWDWDVRTGRVYYSHRWKAMLGLPDDAVSESLDAWLVRVHPDDADRLRAQLAAYAGSGAGLFESEYRIRHADDTWLWILSSGAADRDEKGRAVRIAGSQSDITRGKLADPLCGVPNRLGILDRLEGLFERYRADPGRDFAVIYFDLDRFKLINDSLGHFVGDELLRGVVQRVEKVLLSRGADGYCLGRIGGDEFVALLDDSNGAAEIALAILTEMKAPFHLFGHTVFASTSVGIALGSGSSDNAENVLQNADAAMYHAKSGGRGQYAVFDGSMQERASARLRLETALRQAVDREEFVLHYQPQVCLRTGELRGFEALLRWQRGNRLVAPTEFIGIAEETGLIVPLGRWVIERACRQMSEWKRRFALAESVSVSVNLSCRQFTDPGLIDLIRDVLAVSRLPAAALRLEVTESVLADDPGAAHSVLEELSGMGIGLEIDDFGTGYSSLSQLHRLPFHTLKVDRAFVQAMDRGPEGRDIVNTIANLAGSLGISIVAEGIETPEHWRELEQMGCQVGQGYFFGVPSDARVTAEIIRRRRCHPWDKPPQRSDFAQSLAAIQHRGAVVDEVSVA
jgi:diguanylate cyclase (GGDEF)-like protein